MAPSPPLGLSEDSPVIPGAVRVLRAALAAALLLAAGPALARVPPAGEFPGQRPNDYRYSISVGPSLLAPRMNDFNAALRTYGFNYLQQTIATYDIRPGMTSSGFPETDLGYGAQIHLLYEFDEDLRGGLQITLSTVTSSGTAPPHTDSSSYASGTMMVTSSSAYTASYRASIPALEIGLSLQKVFRFDETPRMNLYLGGWGSIGMLTAAVLNGSVAQETPGGTRLNVRDFSSDLSGMGWGAGGVGGIEYQLSRLVRLFAEGGFQHFRIMSVEQVGDVNGRARRPGGFTNERGGPITLDYTGVFIRIGGRTGLGG